MLPQVDMNNINRYLCNNYLTQECLRLQAYSSWAHVMKHIVLLIPMSVEVFRGGCHKSTCFKDSSMLSQREWTCNASQGSHLFHRSTMDNKFPFLMRSKPESFSPSVPWPPGDQIDEASFVNSSQGPAKYLSLLNDLNQQTKPTVLSMIQVRSVKAWNVRF